MKAVILEFLRVIILIGLLWMLLVGAHSLAGIEKELHTFNDSHIEYGDKH